MRGSAEIATRPAHFGLRLRRRGTGYLLNCNAMKLGDGLRRVDFQNLGKPQVLTGEGSNRGRLASPFGSPAGLLFTIDVSELFPPPPLEVGGAGVLTRAAGSSARTQSPRPSVENGHA
jgi:hypothetical protein